MLTSNMEVSQVGGSHYESGTQHYQLAIKLKPNWPHSNFIKYVARHKKKNGDQDLLKAVSYLHIWYAEFEEAGPNTSYFKNKSYIDEFVSNLEDEAQKVLIKESFMMKEKIDLIILKQKLLRFYGLTQYLNPDESIQKNWFLDEMIRLVNLTDKSFLFDHMRQLKPSYVDYRALALMVESQGDILEEPSDIVRDLMLFIQVYTELSSLVGDGEILNTIVRQVFDSKNSLESFGALYMHKVNDVCDHIKTENKYERMRLIDRAVCYEYINVAKLVKEFNTDINKFSVDRKYFERGLDRGLFVTCSYFLPFWENGGFVDSKDFFECSSRLLKRTQEKLTLSSSIVKGEC